MPNKVYAYKVAGPMTPAQKAAVKQASIEQARLQGAEIATDQDGITWALTEGFPGLTVKRRMD